MTASRHRLCGRRRAATPLGIALENVSLSPREAEQRRVQRQLSLDDGRVLTFNEWCALNGIGKRTGRRILTSGSGPVVTQLSERRIGITVGNNRRWQESRARS